MKKYDPDSYYPVAKIIKSHGVRGEIKIEPLTPYFNLCDFSGGCLVTDRFSGQSVRSVRALNIQGRIAYMSLSGTDDRNESDKLSGGMILLKRGQLPELPEGEHFVFDLIGLSVITEDGQHIGILSDIREGPAYDWYEVTLNGKGTRHLVPAVSDFIRKLDVENGCVIIRPAPGLFGETDDTTENGSRADD